MKLSQAFAMLLVGFAIIVIDGSSPASLAPPEAHAAVSIAYSLDELVGLSHDVVVGKATERRSVWEHVGGSRRIVTYTRVEVEQSTFGKTKKAVWVRALGGAVGRIGQQVSGEAEIRLHKRALLFLVHAGNGKTVVAGAAQGHFLLSKPKKKGISPLLLLSPHRGEVLPRRGPAALSIAQALRGKNLKEAMMAIRAAKTRVSKKRTSPSQQRRQP